MEWNDDKLNEGCVPENGNTAEPQEVSATQAAEQDGATCCPDGEQEQACAADATPGVDGCQTTEQQAGEQQDNPPQGWWAKTKGCVAKACKWLCPVLKKRWGMIAAIVLLVVLIVIGLRIYYSISAKRDYYESLSQTILEMKKISEFCTATYVGEVMVIDEEKHFLKKKNIVLIVKGKVRAGFDLTKMQTEVVGDTTINVTIPPPTVLDIITNPSDIRTFSEKGSWSHERTTITKNAARAKLLELVMEENLLLTAEDNGLRQLEAIFSAFGFKHVNINLANSADDDDFDTVIGDSVSTTATALVSQ